MIKQWQERTAEITGILTTRHIQEAMQAEIDELRAEKIRLTDLAQGRLEQMQDDRKQALKWRDENAKLRDALETCATTLNQAGFRKQADIAYAALGEKS